MDESATTPGTIHIKIVCTVLLVAYVLALLWLTLFKLSLDISLGTSDSIRTLNLIPFTSLSDLNLRETIANFIVFIPLGLLLSPHMKWAGLGKKLTLILILSTAIETIQFIFAIGIADITDVATNTGGGFLGLLLYTWGNARISPRHLDRFIVVGSGLSLATLLIVFWSGLLRFPTMTPPDAGMLHERRSSRP